MSDSITLNGIEVPVNIKRYRNSKNIRLRVNTYGEVVVTCPKRTSKKVIFKFIESQEKWLLEQLAGLEPGSREKSQKNYKLQKESARTLIKKLIDKFNTYYGLKYNKLYIKNQRSIWGSCSKRKNLNFNYRLVSLPLELQEYIVVHELCHLKYMDHSSNFWNLVAETIPDHRRRRRLLRTYEKSLF
jgi:predicted metal-dependent hydrolase